MGGWKDRDVLELRSAYERLNRAGRQLRGGAETALGLKDHSEREAAFSALEHWCRKLARVLWAGEQLYDALTDPDKSSDEQLVAMGRWNRATDGLRRMDYREGPGQPDVYCDVCGKHGHARCGMKEARAELEDPRTLKAG